MTFKEDALRCFEQCRFEAAVFHAENFACEEPGNLNSQQLLARCLFAAGDHRRLVLKFRKSENLEILSLVARSLFALGEFSDCEEFLKGRADFSVLSIVQAKLADRSQNLEKVKFWMSKAIEQEPNCWEAASRLSDSGLVNKDEEISILALPDSSTAKLQAATALFKQRDILKAFEISRSLAAEGFVPVAPLHAALLRELNETNELFFYAHKLLHEHSDKPEAWFVAGCFYLATDRPDSARKFFGKATQISSSFSPAWFAYGHAFALSDESDPALAVYRSCHRLFPKSSLSPLYLGRESIRNNALPLAEKYLWTATDAGNDNPEVIAELGCCAFSTKNYAAAAGLFRRATELNPTEGVYFSNLGFALLKSRDTREAEKAFERAIALKGSAHAMLGLGFARHLQGKLDSAVDAYNCCMRAKTVTNMMVVKTLLTVAMAETRCETVEVDRMSIASSAR